MHGYAEASSKLGKNEKKKPQGILVKQVESSSYIHAN